MLSARLVFKNLACDVTNSPAENIAIHLSQALGENLRDEEFRQETSSSLKHVILFSVQLDWNNAWAHRRGTCWG